MSGHKLFFKQFVQFLNTADENLAQQLISPKAQFYVTSQLEAFEGPKGYLQIIGMIRSGFSDVQWKLEDIILEKDKYGIQFSIESTQNGSLNEKESTIKSIKTHALNTYRLANNQIIEGYEYSLDGLLKHQINKIL
jgi:predicted ester cyclase